MLELMQWWIELPAKYNDAIIIVVGTSLFLAWGMWCHHRDTKKAEEIQRQIDASVDKVKRFTKYY